jgi:hypothetical protein
MIVPLERKVRLPPYRPSRHRGVLEVQLYPYSTTTVGGVSGHHHAPDALTPEKYQISIVLV